MQKVCKIIDNNRNETVLLKNSYSNGHAKDTNWFEIYYLQEGAGFNSVWFLTL